MSFLDFLYVIMSSRFFVATMELNIEFSLLFNESYLGLFHCL